MAATERRDRLLDLAFPKEGDRYQIVSELLDKGADPCYAPAVPGQVGMRSMCAPAQALVC